MTETEDESPENAPTTQTSPFEMIEKFTKASVAVVTLSYGIGLLVSNQYLTGLGVTGFSSVRPKYVLTGFWTLLLIMSACMPVLFAYAVSFFLHVKNDRIYLMRRIIFGFITSAVSFPAILYLLQFDSHGISPNGVYHFIGFVGLNCVVAWLVIELLAMGGSAINRVPVIYYLLASLVFCFGIAKDTHDVAERIYSNVPETLGGGESLSGKIMLNDKGEQFWKTMNLPGDNLKNGLSTILYQDDKVMVITVLKQVPASGKIPELETMILDKEFVGAVILNKNP